MTTDPFSIKDVITTILAALGTGLGIFNAVKAHRRDKITLKVTPGLFQLIPEGIKSSWRADTAKNPNPNSALCISVQNTGLLPATVEEVGFLLTDATRIVLLDLEFYDGGTALPRKVEPHSAFSAYLPKSQKAASEGMKDLDCVYVRTACGQVFTGNSPALKVLIKKGNKAAKTGK